jgi:hypothetical protein
MNLHKAFVLFAVTTNLSLYGAAAAPVTKAVTKEEASAIGQGYVAVRHNAVALFTSSEGIPYFLPELVQLVVAYHGCCGPWSLQKVIDSGYRPSINKVVPSVAYWQDPEMVSDPLRTLDISGLGLESLEGLNSTNYPDLHRVQALDASNNALSLSIKNENVQSLPSTYCFVIMGDLRILNLSKNKIKSLPALYYEGVCRRSRVGSLDERQGLVTHLDVSENPGIELTIPELQAVEVLRVNHCGLANLDTVFPITTRARSLRLLFAVGNNLQEIPDRLMVLPSLDACFMAGNCVQDPEALKQSLVAARARARLFCAQLDLEMQRRLPVASVVVSDKKDAKS